MSQAQHAYDRWLVDDTCRIAQHAKMLGAQQLQTQAHGEPAIYAFADGSQLHILGRGKEQEVKVFQPKAKANLEPAPYRVMYSTAERPRTEFVGTVELSSAEEYRDYFLRLARGEEISKVFGTIIDSWIEFIHRSRL